MFLQFQLYCQIGLSCIVLEDWFHKNTLFSIGIIHFSIIHFPKWFWWSFCPSLQYVKAEIGYQVPLKCAHHFIFIWYFPINYLPTTHVCRYLYLMDVSAWVIWHLCWIIKSAKGIVESGIECWWCGNRHYFLTTMFSRN